MIFKLKLIRTSRILLLMLTAVFLSSCITEEDSCKDIVATAGEPDMTASPVFAAPEVAQNNTIDVNVAVDDETIEGTVFLLPVGSQTIADAVSTVPFITAVGGSAETVVVTLPIVTPPVGEYYPVVILCEPDVLTCTTGAGYVEDISGILAEAGNYVRGTANGANGNTIDLSSLKDSCIEVNTVAVIL